jgi:hypothetical protein
LDQQTDAARSAPSASVFWRSIFLEFVVVRSSFDFPPAELSEVQYRDVSNLSAAQLRATFRSNDGNSVSLAN